MTRRRALAVALAAVALIGMAPAPASAAAPDCDISDATLSWGFKESFRAYIDGSIANGEWSTDGDVAYETPEFTWSGGVGGYDVRTGEGSVEFDGSVRFTGHDGVLDTTIADPVVRFDDGFAELLLDVSGPTMEGDQVEVRDAEFAKLVPPDFVAGHAGGYVRLEATSTLTEDGAVAFPNYAPGETFDPVTLEMRIGFECAERLVVDPWALPLLLLLWVVPPLVAVTVVVIVLLWRRRRA
jgi:hypothetical protein